MLEFRLLRQSDARLRRRIPFQPEQRSVAGFERGYSFLESSPCDILITPHPDTSNLWERFEQKKKNPDAFLDRDACWRLAAASRSQLEQRFANEKGPGIRRPN